MKYTILIILNDPSPYWYYEGIMEPDVSWPLGKDSYVGIWTCGWGDLIAKAVMSISNDFNIEVWQPDLRADKVYTYSFNEGWTHKLFPATEQEYYLGVKKIKYIYSESIIAYLKRDEYKSAILHLQGISDLYLKIIDRFYWHKIVLTMHGTILLPFMLIFKLRRNFAASLFYIWEHFKVKRLINNIDVITYQNEKNLKHLTFIYHNRLAKLTMGVDFERFRHKDKHSCREILGLPQNKKIILSVSRLNKLKQLHKAIEVMNGISHSYDFIYIIIGKGDSAYEEQLHNIGKSLIEKGNLLFAGYKYGEELIDYYNSADLFLMTSDNEAGPVACMEAMACGVPILMTNVGNCSEVLASYQRGYIVDRKDYSSWDKGLSYFLSGGIILALESDLAREHYDWSHLGSKIVDIYNQLQ